jgi:outer membrane immunogenic protein
MAGAADMSMNNMPMNMATKASAPPPYQWTGCYIGLNAGAAGAASDFTTTVGTGTYLVPGDATEVTNDGTGSANTTNFLGGGQAGCNWQNGTVVFGLEGDFDYFHSNSSFSNNTNTLPVSGLPFNIGQSLTTDYFATVRPRVGIAADRSLAYVTGGAAFTDVSYTESYADGGAPPGAGIATASKLLTGWTAGAGWEYAWTDHWTFKIEYLYSGFSRTSATGVTAGPGGGNPLSGSADLVIQTLRGGVNYKF